MKKFVTCVVGALACIAISCSKSAEKRISDTNGVVFLSSGAATIAGELKNRQEWQDYLANKPREEKEGNPLFEVEEQTSAETLYSIAVGMGECGYSQYRLKTKKDGRLARFVASDAPLFQPLQDLEQRQLTALLYGDKPQIYSDGAKPSIVCISISRGGDVDLRHLLSARRKEIGSHTIFVFVVAPDVSAKVLIDAMNQVERVWNTCPLFVLSGQEGSYLR